MQELLSIGTAIATVVAIGVGVVSTIIVAYAGLMYATAAGDPQKTGIAKNAFIGAFIGLIIAGVAFIGPRIVTDMVIKPVGGIAVETEIGLNCDGILRNQLVFQRGASIEARMNVVIAQIQSQNSDCASDVWDPRVIDLKGTAGTDDADGNCYGAQGLQASVAAGATADKFLVGSQLMPEALLRPTGTAATPWKARKESGRDSENNVIVYFHLEPGQRPSDGASCWLYFARLKSWHANFY